MSDIKGDVLPECQVGFTDIRIAVGLIEKDIITQTKITDKLTEAIEKIEELNANIFKMLAVHDLKHENASEDIKELDHRLEEFIGHDGKHCTTTTTTTVTDEQTKKTLDQLNKWKWMLIGGALVLGWILAHLKWDVLAKLFGG